MDLTLALIFLKIVFEPDLVSSLFKINREKKKKEEIYIEEILVSRYTYENITFGYLMILVYI